MADTFDIEIIRGDDWAGLKVRWLDADGAVVSLDTARMQIRDSATSAATQLSLTEGSGITIDGSNYVIPVITAAQSANLTNGVYDIEATSLAGTVKTLVRGRVKIILDVTR